MNNYKNKFILIIMLVIIAICFFVFTYFKSKREFETSYNFVITGLSTTPTKSIEFYSAREKIILWNYKISKNRGVKIGDLVYKKKKSRYLYIYREGKIYLKVEPTGIFFPVFENF